MSQIQTQTKGLKRDTIDKYYTKPDTVDLCLSLVKKHVVITPDDLAIEPSAGNGAFVAGIKTIAAHSKFYDLDPDDIHGEITKQNYLSYDSTEIARDFPNIHVIGNPPFGRQSSLAIKFIKKSCGFCTSISFILPKSFKKDSLKKTFPPQFHLVCEQDMPDKSFIVSNSEHDVPCVFQIWLKKDSDRPISEKVVPRGFRFVKKDEMPDISLRRVGVNAGTVDTRIDGKSEQSHYFIKFLGDESLPSILTRLAAIEYAFNNTVGPRSISKPEVIARFNPMLS